MGRTRAWLFLWRKGIDMGFLTAIGLCLIFIVKANLDFADGYYHLFMDELVTSDGVQKILHPSSYRDFYYQITDGGDHRYGRILWNFSALASLLPERMFGATGQIVATRLANAVALLFGYWVLVSSFLTGFRTRLAVFVALLALPHTVYYTTMPKPEPLQLLFLSLFLRGHLKVRPAQPRHWFWYGAALGTKISVTVLAPLFALTYFLRIHGKHREGYQPTRVLDYLRSVNFSWLKSRLRDARIQKLLMMAFFWFMVGLLFAVPILLKGKVAQWVVSTFLNTGHGADDRSITAIHWLKYILSDYTALHPFAVFGLIMVAIALTAWGVRRYWRVDSQYQKEDLTQFLYLVFAASLMLLPIVLFVKRIWGFYLHVAMVLLLTGVAGLMVCLIQDRKIRGGGHHLGLLTGTLAAVSLIFQLQANISEWLQLSRRSSNPAHLEKVRQYHEIQRFLDHAQVTAGRRISIYLDPVLYRLESNDRQEVTNFWGFFKQWSDNRDFVIYSRKHWEIPMLPKTSKEYEDSLEAQLLRKKHVEEPTCTDSCYKVAKMSSDYVILARR
jgi:hypothetical protein